MDQEQLFKRNMRRVTLCVFAVVLALFAGEWIKAETAWGREVDYAVTGWLVFVGLVYLILRLRDARSGQRS